MDEKQIFEALQRFDTARSPEHDAAWASLRPLGINVVPFLADAYLRTTKYQGRTALVYHAIRFARRSDIAFELGINALKDKASLVRYRACCICAYSLRNEAIPHLESLLTHADSKTVEDARAAIDAIRRKNHHFFVDRTHSGMTFWRANPEDSDI